MNKLNKLKSIFYPHLDFEWKKYGNNFRASSQYSKLKANDYKLLNEIVDIDIETNEGVYLIGDFYVGKTIDNGYSAGIKNRIITHLSEMFYADANKYYDNLYEGDWDYVRYNYIKTHKMWRDFNINGHLRVKQLSDDIDDEKYYINQYMDKHSANITEYLSCYKNEISYNEYNCLRYIYGWRVDNIYFKSHNYVKILNNKNAYRKSLLNRYLDNDINRTKFINLLDKFKIGYEIFDNNFNHFVDNHRKMHEILNE